jgi:hypothetical protein
MGSSLHAIGMCVPHHVGPPACVSPRGALCPTVAVCNEALLHGFISWPWVQQLPQWFTKAQPDEVSTIAKLLKLAA